MLANTIKHKTSHSKKEQSLSHTETYYSNQEHASHAFFCKLALDEMKK